MSKAYYNDNDPFACAWLRELIAEGLIADGDVDERSLLDVKPSEVTGYTQCHYFAGIGIWSLALRVAGWPDDRPVWTGSEPCQPFSDAGKGKGFADERYLRPYWQHLIRVCRPPTLFGEQVASKDGLAWLDVISSDLEGEDYAFGAVDTCVAGFGSPHIRQRLSWVAHAYRQDQSGRGIQRPRESFSSCNGSVSERSVGLCATGRMGDNNKGLEGHRDRYQAESGRQEPAGSIAETSKLSGLADAYSRERLGEPIIRGAIEHGSNTGRPESCGQLEPCGENERPGPTNGFWRNADWLHCRDEKWRAVAPGTFPLVDGGTLRNRVAELRGAGNAVNVAQQAGFIKAFLEAESLGFVEQWGL